MYFSSSRSRYMGSVLVRFTLKLPAVFVYSSPFAKKTAETDARKLYYGTCNVTFT